MKHTGGMDDKKVKTAEENGGFDARTLRKEITRKHHDYSLEMIQTIYNDRRRLSYRDYSVLYPHAGYYKQYLSPFSCVNVPGHVLGTYCAFTAVNKLRTRLDVIKWSPEGKRLLVGGKSGEITLWNGFSFHFETLMQAHDEAIQDIVWSNNGDWLITSDHVGVLKYWQRTLNNVKIFSAHSEAVNGISFAPTDTKFATCSSDKTIKLWDFLTTAEEQNLMGHCWDVKCIDWHPEISLISSGGRDNMIKLWDPRAGESVMTLHNHKNTVLSTKWNKQNTNWLLTCGRDNLINLFDLRTTKEFQVFKGHKKDVQAISWHPLHSSFFASGSYDGTILYWKVGCEQPVYCSENAHDGGIASLDWHPFGHCLSSGASDGVTRFWIKKTPAVEQQQQEEENVTVFSMFPGLDSNKEDRQIPSTQNDQGIEKKLQSADPRKRRMVSSIC